MKRLGLIVEDRSDAEVLEVLAQKITGATVVTQRVLAKGCGRMHAKAAAWAAALSRRCVLLMLVCDLDDHNLEELSKALSGALRGCAIARYAVIIPVRELEAWLLADHEAITKSLKLRKAVKRQASPETVPRPKERLRDLIWERSGGGRIYLNTIDNVRIAKAVEIERLRQCRSFLPFEQFLRVNLCRNGAA